MTTGQLVSDLVILLLTPHRGTTYIARVQIRAAANLIHACPRIYEITIVVLYIAP